MGSINTVVFFGVLIIINIIYSNYTYTVSTITIRNVSTQLPDYEDYYDLGYVVTDTNGNNYDCEYSLGNSLEEGRVYRITYYYRSVFSSNWTIHRAKKIG